MCQKLKRPQHNLNKIGIILASAFGLLLVIVLLQFFSIYYVEKSFANIPPGMSREDINNQLRFFRRISIKPADIEIGWRNQIDKDILRNEHIIIERYVFVVFPLDFILIFNQENCMIFRLATYE